MDWRNGPTMEEERQGALPRARGAQNGGGAAGPSTIQGEKMHVIPKD